MVIVIIMISWKRVAIIQAGDDEGLDNCRDCLDIKDSADPADVVKMVESRAADISDVGFHAKLLVEEDITKIERRGRAADEVLPMVRPLMLGCGPREGALRNNTIVSSSLSLSLLSAIHRLMHNKQASMSEMESGASAISKVR